MKNKFILIRNQIINISEISRIVFFNETNNIAILYKNSQDSATNINCKTDGEFERIREYLIEQLDIKN